VGASAGASFRQKEGPAECDGHSPPVDSGTSRPVGSGTKGQTVRRSLAPVSLEGWRSLDMALASI
jgi:hypothetical protein